jgi:hypothetical protein
MTTTFSREPHAAHVGSEGGWDLEWIDVTGVARPNLVIGLPRGFGSRGRRRCRKGSASG